MNATTTTHHTAVELAEDDVLTTADLAAWFGMSPRRLRRVFRAAGMGCGRGSIYAATVNDVPGIEALIDTVYVR